MSLCEGPNMGIYARRHSRVVLAPPLPKKAAQPDSCSGGDLPSRVRILSGPLAGLICDVVSTADRECWLLRTAWDGVFLRVDPRVLERLPAH
jgi:hypothetical protein